MSTISVSLAVPSQGTGPYSDISAIIGEKTVSLNGQFVGSYEILVSDDSAGPFVPVLSFNAGQGQLKQSIAGAFKFALIRSYAIPLSPIECTISGVVMANENKFATISTFNPGDKLQGPIVDTHALFPPSGLEDDIAFLCSGSFKGSVIIFGSEDGSEWNPVVAFQAGLFPQGSPALEFSPQLTQNIVRYLQARSTSSVLGVTKITVGGRVPSAGGGSGGSIIAGEGLQGGGTLPGVVELSVQAANASITVSPTGISVNTAVIVPSNRTVTAGDGLMGGGDLSANRSLAVKPADSSISVSPAGVAVNTAVVVPSSRTVAAGDGLTGGGNLSANIGFAVLPDPDGSIEVTEDGVKVGVLADDQQHGERGGGSQHALAVPSVAAGFISGEDQAKLNGIPSFNSVDVNSPGPYTVQPEDFYLQIRYTTTAPISIQLPSISSGERIIVLVDSGYASATNPITVVPDGADKINNLAETLIININGSAIWLHTNIATQNWEIV